MGMFPLFLGNINMNLTKPDKDDFINLFNEIAPDKGRHAVFQDFVEMASYSLHNAFNWSNKFEESYLSIAHRYKADDLKNMSKMLGLTIVRLHNSPEDFLGDIYMSLQLGELAWGEYSFASLVAKLTLHDIDALVKEKGFLTLRDPTCGAGGLAIAQALTFQQAGYDLEKQFFIQCVDIDPVATAMCFIQLTVMGVPAEVLTGNSLTLESSKVMRTASYYRHNWKQCLKTTKRVS